MSRGSKPFGSLICRIETNQEEETVKEEEVEEEEVEVVVEEEADEEREEEGNPHLGQRRLIITSYVRVKAHNL